METETMTPVYKSFTTVSRAVDEIAGVYEAMISTESEDRQGDIVRAAGAQVESYMRNPVVLWAHDYSELPVARTLDIQVVPGIGIRATFQFPDWGISEKADTVRRLWAGGYLNATSIGFQPLVSQEIRSSQGVRAQEFTQWELLEYSIVPVPANAEALRLAIKTLTVEKYGRVLSTANEKRIREAAQMLQDVLDGLGEPQSEEQAKAEALPETTASEPPNMDDHNSDGAEKLADTLSDFLDVLFGKEEV